VHGEGWRFFFFFFSTNTSVRETSGTEGEAKKEIYKRYIYTYIYIYIYNTNKYIFLYPLFLEKSTLRWSGEARAYDIELISISYLSLCLLIVILMIFFYWNATICRPIRVRYLRSRSEKRVNRFLLIIVNRRDCRRTRLNVTPTKIQGVITPTF